MHKSIGGIFKVHGLTFFPVFSFLEYCGYFTFKPEERNAHTYNLWVAEASGAAKYRFSSFQKPQIFGVHVGLMGLTDEVGVATKTNKKNSINHKAITLHRIEPRGSELCIEPQHSNNINDES